MISIKFIIYYLISKGVIPRADKEHNDLIDIIIEASQSVETVETEEGQTQKQLVLDPERVYWKTHIVNSPTFARFVYELKELEHLALQCKNHMSWKRAEVLKTQIMNLVASFKYSIDAKSSESLRDKNNTQSTLIDKINKNKIEKAYTIKDDAKKSIWSGLVGNDVERSEGE